MRTFTKEQIRTVPITIQTIMLHPAFRRGLDDVRRGIAFDWRVNSWNYERGRLFARIAPVDMPLFINGNLNPKAVDLFAAAFNRNYVI